jgi:hypothetical protein
LKRVLVVSLSDLASDPRVDRQIAALRSQYAVVAAGLRPPRWPDVEFIEIAALRRAKRHLPLALAQVLARRYGAAFWSHPTNASLYESMRDVRADVVLANELDTLPAALRLGRPVVFDAHEYSEDEIGEKFWWRALLAPYVRWRARTFIPQAASMTTVAPAIADAYKRDTGVRAEVVLNAPAWHDLEPTPVHDPVRVLHHGFAYRGRKIEEMVAAAGSFDARFVTDFVLVEHSRGYRDELIRLAGSNPRIRFPEPWPMHEIVRRANDYDIGLFSLPPVNLNSRWALPNKLFEFIQGRLAVVVGPSQEMSRIVRKYECGIVAENFSADAVTATMNALDSAAIAGFKRASHVAAAELCAEKNVPVLLRAVEDALAHGAPAR